MALGFIFCPLNMPGVCTDKKEQCSTEVVVYLRILCLSEIRILLHLHGVPKCNVAQPTAVY